MCALSTLLTQGNSGANSSLHFAELAQLVERRLAKAKVAGSNPVFRSKSPGFRALGGSGLFMAFAFHGDAARSQRLRGVVALRGEPAHWRIVPMPFPGSLEQGWNICLRL